MGCNCTSGRSGGSMDDASVNYLYSLIKDTPSIDAGDEISLLDIENPLINLLVEIIKEKAQYLNEAGLEYLIMRLRQKYVERVPDKGLSSNDFTDDLKTKLEGLPNGKDLQDILDSINSAEWEVVNVLPTKGEKGKIYLVKLASPPSSDNQYAEYIWVTDRWELLGVMSVSGNGLVSTVTLNGSTITPSTAGVLALGALVKSIKFNGATYNVTANGSIDLGTVDIPETDLTGAVQSITLNGSTITPTTAGVAALGALVKSITMNGSTKNVGTTGTLALGAVCTKITLNGTTYSVGTTGTIALGTIESGGGGGNIHTGTTNPASTLGEDGDFYYKMK